MTRREKTAEKLIEGLNALLTEEGVRAWLKARKTFHKYSWRNQLMIAMQRPDTKRVAGYHAWRKNWNRQVQKGSHAIWIFGPNRVTVEDEKTGEKATAMRGIVPVKVFAVEDTEPIEGAEVIPLNPPQGELSIDDPEELDEVFDRLRGRLFSQGYDVILTADLPDSTGGYHDREQRVIAINSNWDILRRLRALVHESCHKADHELDTAEDYAHNEVVVDAATYIVLDGLGIANTESLSYIASWGDLTAAEQVKARLERIDRIASRIESALASDREEEHGEGREEGARGERQAA
jgi:hypothetical protein